MKKAVIICLILSPYVSGWVTRRSLLHQRIGLLSLSTLNGKVGDGGEVKETDNPCWQDIYDDDCSMSNAYSANFVAGKWIKSMPCAAGIEVSSRE